MIVHVGGGSGGALAAFDAATGADRWIWPSAERDGPAYASAMIATLHGVRQGRLLWAGPGRQGENASLVVAGGDALVLTTEAELLVLKADADRFAPVATYGVGDSATWAHLAVGANAVLAKDVRTLALWRVP